MTDTPTPGQPLSEADVSLLQPRDWLLHTGRRAVRFHTLYGYVGEQKVVATDAAGSFQDYHGFFTFLGRPDQDGWIAWHGGDNPVPGSQVEIRERSGRAGVVFSDHVVWSNPSGVRPSRDIIAYRPHAPVSRPGDGVEGMPWLESALIEHLRSMGCKCPSPLIGYRPNTGPRCRLCNIEPVSRPAGEGETTQHTPRCWGRTSYSDEMAHCYCKPAGEGEREAVARIIDPAAFLFAPDELPKGSRAQYDAFDKADRIITLLSPAAPDAGGGALGPLGEEPDSALKIATDLHAAYEQLIYGLPKYLDAKNLTDEENMIREAYITLDVTAHRLAALKQEGE